MTNELGDLAVQIATLAGEVRTVIARMEAGDRQSAQLVTLVKDQLTYQAADLGEVKALMREMNDKHETAVNAVRLDLESKIEAANVRINDLEKWRARVGGIAAASAAFSSVLTGVVIKAMGA